MGHRINERNTGHYSLESNAKSRSRKHSVVPELSQDQELALNGYLICQNLIKSHDSGYISYVVFDLNSPQIAHWYANGIVTPMERKSDYANMPSKTICQVNEASRPGLELCMGLLKGFYKLEPYL